MLYVKLMLPWLYFKNMIPIAHKLPRIMSALLVTVFTSFLIIYIYIYIYIYLFVKILCHLMYKYVYFTHAFFNPLSNYFKFLKYELTLNKMKQL